MLAHVILDHLRHQTCNRASYSGDQMHDLFTAHVIVERTLDAIDLSPNTAEPRERFLFFTDRMSHVVLWHRPPPYASPTRKCPSADNLRLIRLSAKRGSGSSGLE